MLIKMNDYSIRQPDHRYQAISKQFEIHQLIDRDKKYSHAGNNLESRN